ncbi:MAG: hypothetical protein O6943_06510, partial [Bacteroidetes bacterium]|nr:hypothetical protein [Bacteroidota bacterium]
LLLKPINKIKGANTPKCRFNRMSTSPLRILKKINYKTFQNQHLSFKPTWVLQLLCQHHILTLTLHFVNNFKYLGAK